MINAFINYLALKLYSLYPTYKIYTEEIKQGLVEPCFFINAVNQDIEKKFNLAVLQSASFDLICMLDSETDNSQYHDIAESLNENLELISVNSIYYRTLNKKGEVINGDLHFTFDVKRSMWKAEDAGTKIDEIGITITI